MDKEVGMVLLLPQDLFVFLVFLCLFVFLVFLEQRGGDGVTGAPRLVCGIGN